MGGASGSKPDGEGIRLDKWLWAARFFKTRRLATEAIAGGKVELDGRRPKPGRLVKVGSRLSIHKEQLEWRITVAALNAQRRPAPEAALLYTEDEDSRLRRQELVRQHREAGGPSAAPRGRPSKRDRRLIHQFKAQTHD